MHKSGILFVTVITIGSSPPNAAHDAEDYQRTMPAAAVTLDARCPRKISAKHLPNLVQVHSKVISGGLPKGDVAFHELQELGVKTLISVDGAKPNVAMAKKHGLQYVHLPHGYDGVPDERVKELAKAVRELAGPVYIHCHHGKHRSPVAASVACVAAGLISQADGLSVLKLAGTNAKYRGLYQSAREVTPLEEAQLVELNVKFREVADVPAMAEAMVALESTQDNLKRIAAARWRTLEDHPDLEPAHEALLLREHFAELLRTDYGQLESNDFKQFLRDSEELARTLEDTLRTWQPAGPEAEPPPSLDRISGRILANCTGCHQQYRDTPRCEK